MEIIDQVRQASSIVEIASQYTTLKRRGRKWVGLCPFHTEKTPSFTVDDEKQLYHCFGCGVGGDIFSLVMERENLTFPEALKHLAEKYHVPLPEQQRVRPEVLKLEEKLFKINDLALGFFKKNLFNTQEGAKALEYLKKRGLSDETIQTLKIGYALNSWTALLDFFQAKNVPVSLLEKGGLVLPGSQGRGIPRPVPRPGHLPHLQPDGKGRRLRRPDGHRRRAEVPELAGDAPLLQGQAPLRPELHQGRRPGRRDGRPGRGLHGFLGPLPGRDPQRRRLPGDGPDGLAGRPGSCASPRG